MKREIIERLAIDSAAGELNEDTETLFKTYLAEHPELNEWAEEMSIIYGETEAAVNKKTGGLNSDIKTELIRSRHHRINLRPVMRWAAVVIFAACIGLLAGRWSKPDTTIPHLRIVSVTPSLSEKQSDLDLMNVGDGFWRDKAVAMLTPGNSIAGRNIIRGDSLWDKYRQYIKEKGHE
jgi:hypothetical protein